MKKCTVRSLRRAAQNGGIPSDILATAALDLCDGLQDKLDASTKIIQVILGRKAYRLKLTKSGNKSAQIEDISD